MVFPTKSIIDSADKQRKNKTHRVPAFFFGSLLGLLFVSVLRFARRVPDPSRNSHRLLCFFDFNSAAVIHNGLPLERTEFFPKLFRPPFCDVPGIKVTHDNQTLQRGVALKLITVSCIMPLVRPVGEKPNSIRLKRSGSTT